MKLLVELGSGPFLKVLRARFAVDGEEIAAEVW
jgi:hypothetical protein